MADDSGPFHINSAALIFRPDNTATTKTLSPTFFPELEAEFGNFADHILIQTYAFSEPWPTWEMHPEGDEFVYLLEGDTDMVLYNPDGEDRVLRVSEPGSYVVVPKGAWHTARPYTRTSMLFVTPGEGTLNAETPGGEHG